MIEQESKAFARLFSGIFASFGALWLVAVLVSCITSGAMIGGIGYAIYWGLSLAERAVEVQESERDPVESEVTASGDRD